MESTADWFGDEAEEEEIVERRRQAAKRLGPLATHSPKDLAR